MKHAIATLIAVAAIAFAGTASARHDDYPHGYSKARAIAVAQAQASKPVYIGVGPRAHDFATRNVVLRQPRTEARSPVR